MQVKIENTESKFKRTNEIISTDDIIKESLSNPVMSMRKLCKLSLFRFMVFLWDTYSSDEFIPNWHIEKVCEQLEKVAKRVSEKLPKEHDVIINVPPGTTKTAMVSIFFPVWCWVNWHWMRFITTSHSWDLSLESAEYSRDIIRSEKFRLLYPEIDIKQDKDKKSNFRVIRKTLIRPGYPPRTELGGGRVSTSVGAKVTGFHAHIIIPDDLIDPDGVMSEVILNKTNRYVDHILSTRKVDKKVSVMVMIMQRLHEVDPTGHLLKKKGIRIKQICLPGEIVNYKEQLQPKEYAEFYKDGLLDPNRMPWEVLKEMEAAIGQYGFAGQVGQKPTPPGGGMFKTQFFQIVTQMPSEVSIERTIRSWDKAGTDEKELQKGKDAAYTAGVKMHKLANGKWLISDRKKGRWAAEERERLIKSTAEADGTKVHILIEQEPGSGGKDSAKATIKNLAGFVVEAEHPSGDKATRADPYSVQVNDGNVLLLKGEWNEDFIDEHEKFPFSKYKDQVDAAAAAFNKLTRKKKARVIGKTRR